MPDRHDHGRESITPAPHSGLVGSGGPGWRASSAWSGRRSPASLYDYELATYDTGDTFDQRLAKGFVELWGLPSKVAADRDRKAAGQGPPA